MLEPNEMLKPTRNAEPENTHFCTASKSQIRNVHHNGTLAPYRDSTISLRIGAKVKTSTPQQDHQWVMIYCRQADPPYSPVSTEQSGYEIHLYPSPVVTKHPYHAPQLHPVNMSGSNNKFAQFKVVLLGESAVGKSSIVHRFVKNTFDDMRESTIGAAFLTQSITLPESNTTVKFEIWDTAGQERYKSLAPMYYRKANAALCVYDITSKASFERAQDWIKELKRQAPEDIVICLVGNKCDLSLERQVTADEVREYVSLLNQDSSKIITQECSAKTGDGVVDIFDQIAKALPVEEVVGGTRSKARTSGVDLGRGNRGVSSQNASCC